MSFLPVISIMAIIFAFSHMQGSQLPDGVNGQDKFFHIIAYTALGLTAIFAVREQWQKKTAVISAGIILFCFLYGISDEFHQSFIPGRTPSGFDLMADLTGGIIAAGIWFIRHKKRHPSK
jgi:VanZ family protein